MRATPSMGVQPISYPRSGRGRGGGRRWQEAGLIISSFRALSFVGLAKLDSLWLLFQANEIKLILP